MEQVKRDRHPAVPVSRVRTGGHYTGRYAAQRHEEGGSGFVQGLVFRCILAALLFMVFCLGWWLDTSSGHATREWLRTAVTQDLPESKLYQQIQQWEKAIGSGWEGVAGWFRSIFSPGDDVPDTKAPEQFPSTGEGDVVA